MRRGSLRSALTVVGKGARSRKEGEVKATPKKIGKIGPKRVFLCFLASSEKEASKEKVFTHYSRISFPGGSSVKRAKFVEAILFFYSYYVLQKERCKCSAVKYFEQC